MPANIVGGRNPGTISDVDLVGHRINGHIAGGGPDADRSGRVGRPVDYRDCVAVPIGNVDLIGYWIDGHG